MGIIEDGGAAHVHDWVPGKPKRWSVCKAPECTAVCVTVRSTWYDPAQGRWAANQGKTIEVVLDGSEV